MLNNIIIGMCGVNFTLFGCEEKILSNVHIVQCSAEEQFSAAAKNQVLASKVALNQANAPHKY